jgi:hypothetical protein
MQDAWRNHKTKPLLSPPPNPTFRTPHPPKPPPGKKEKKRRKKKQQMFLMVGRWCLVDSCLEIIPKNISHPRDIVDFLAPLAITP